MASRHADSSRYARERGRYEPPRRPPSSQSGGYRDRERDRPRDRYGDRYDGGRFRDDRDRDYGRDRDRYGDRPRHDDRRDRDSDRRRSRSPPRRERSRDRQGDRYRRDRDYDRDRGYDDRRRQSSPGRRGSSSTASGADGRRDRARDSPRDDRRYKDPAQVEADKKAERAAKLAEWKKLNAERLAKDKVNTPAPGQSPSGTAPNTPIATATPPASNEQQVTTKSKVLQKGAVDKAKPKQPGKSGFRIDELAATRPLATKSVGQSIGKPGTIDSAAKASKADSNIGSFGLKKAAVEQETSNNVILDNADAESKRELQTLPELAARGSSDPETPPSDDNALDDIGSDNEEQNAHVQAQLEKRRADLAQPSNNDVQMDEAPVADPAIESMEVDVQTGAEQEDIDPLDAYMANLPEPDRFGFLTQGQTMFNDELEPDQTAVEEEDLLAFAAMRKKKKEVPTVDHEKVEYEPFRKDFYTEPSEVTQMSAAEVADLRHELDGIKVKPSDVPRPVTKWAQMGLLQATMDVLTKVRYEKPTSIQSQAIPIAESGRDLIGVAKTGSGKTLAFGIPMIRHILDQRPLKSTDGPIGLILAPTRELSLQIVNELKPFLNASGITIKCAYGGQPISDHIAMMKRGGIHVLCATPGRLIDLLQSNSGRVLNFKRITYAVLDEADRMFDLGFEPQVMKILGLVRPDRQTILFSATFPKTMASLARKATTKAAEVIIGGRSQVAPEISQIVTIVPPSYEKKVHRLLIHLGQLFSDDENAQVLIFTERQETAEDLLSKLIKAKYPAVNTIHGAKDQNDRNEAITDFKQGVLSILIATSVAARGLDVPGLEFVLNFDCPTHLEDYVHRCGRTGRAGNKGTAITLLESPGQERFALHVAKALRESGHEVPDEVQAMANIFLEKVKAGTEKYYSGFGGKGLDRLDAARAVEKRREKRALKLEGAEQSDDETDLPVKPVVAVPEPAATGATSESTDQPAYMSILNKQIVVNKTERVTAGANGKPLSAKEQAMAAANRVDGRLSRKGMIHAGQPIDNKGPDAGLYHSTIEINDFPQKARWAVTNRTNVAKILDATGVSITTKGNYYAPGKEPGETDLPKLYILVEGDTENIVKRAMTELTRLLREGTIAAEEASTARTATGRYSVL